MAEPANGSGSVAKALPMYDELPPFKNFSGCAWQVWGEDDQLGTVNMLTDEVVQKSAAEEIRLAPSSFRDLVG